MASSELFQATPRFVHVDHSYSVPLYILSQTQEGCVSHKRFGERQIRQSTSQSATESSPKGALYLELSLLALTGQDYSRMRVGRASL